MNDAKKRGLRLNPANMVVTRLGGAIVVAKAAGVSYTSPYRWQMSKRHGGTSGLIPLRYHARLLRFAKRHNIPLSQQDFLPTDGWRQQ